MMTSQPTDTPKCPKGHGLMVPIDTKYCFVPKDGLVTAVVEWRLVADKVVTVGYATDEETMAELPGGPDMGGKIAQLREDGQLLDFFAVIDLGEGYLRIDDNREGHDWSYMIWLGKARDDYVSFMPGTVYRWFGHNPGTHRFPALSSYSEVLALVSHPEALAISSHDDSIAGLDRDDEKVKQALGELNDRIVVWDLSALSKA